MNRLLICLVLGVTGLNSALCSQSPNAAPSQAMTTSSLTNSTTPNLQLNSTTASTKSTLSDVESTPSPTTSFSSMSPTSVSLSTTSSVSGPAFIQTSLSFATDQPTPSLPTQSQQPTPSLPTQSQQPTPSLTTLSQHSTSSLTTLSQHSTSSMTTQSQHSTSSLTTLSQHSTSSMTTQSQQPTPSVTTHSQQPTPSLTTDTDSQHSTSSMTTYSQQPTLSLTTQSQHSTLSLSTQIHSTSSLTSQIHPTPTLTTESHPTSSLSPSTNPPTTAPTHSVKISETNILLVKDLDSIFIELSGTGNENLEGLFLTIRNAKVKDDATGLLQLLKLTGNLNAHGLLVVDKNQQLNLKNVEFSSVVIALYSDESPARRVTPVSLLDSFLFSVGPGSVDPKVAEVYQPALASSVYVNTSMLNLAVPDISMSLCSGRQVGSGFVLTSMSKNQPNQCALNRIHSFQVKLTQVGKAKCRASHLPNQFDNLLTKEIVTKVNEHQQCGLASFNVEDMNNQAQCVDENQVIAVSFNIKSAFDGQIVCIKIGYESFTAQKSSVVLLGRPFSVSDCSHQCFPNAVPASQNDDDKIKVTVAVVVTCIGVFLVILLAVIIYMKKKRRGLLQFRMTRLDEDDDELVGDMDDFVGNQGATFSNFR